MFGYVTPYKPELKICDWNLYKAYYCGLCHEIKRKYGQLPRFALNYDFVTLAMLADALNNEPVDMKHSRCIASPFKKKCVCMQTKGLSLAADCLVLSAYYKICDDTFDEKGVKSLVYKFLKTILKKQYRLAATAVPNLDEVMQRQMTLQAKLEDENCLNPDKAADPTAIMTATMFELAANCEKDKKPLYRFGLVLGKLIYYLDAAEDFNDDKKKSRYNVYSHLTFDECKKNVVSLCNMSAAEAGLSFNLLDISHCKDILNNIVFLGLSQSISFAGVKRKKEKEQN